MCIISVHQLKKPINFEAQNWSFHQWPVCGRVWVTAGQNEAWLLFVYVFMWFLMHVHSSYLERQHSISTEEMFAEHKCMHPLTEVKTHTFVCVFMLVLTHTHSTCTWIPKGLHELSAHIHNNQTHYHLVCSSESMFLLEVGEEHSVVNHLKAYDITHARIRRLQFLPGESACACVSEGIQRMWLQSRNCSRIHFSWWRIASNAQYHDKKSKTDHNFRRHAPWCFWFHLHGRTGDCLRHTKKRGTWKTRTRS